MIIETERLIIRPWKKNKADAKALYQYAKDQRIGPAAGWPVHRDVADSMEIIRGILSTEGIFAVALKETGRPIGAVGLTYGATARKMIPAGEAELGYWIGVPYWGQGFIPEASRAMLRYAFTDLQMKAVWAGYYAGNEQSRRVQEKCGFTYQYAHEVDVPLLGERRTEHIMRITVSEWEKLTKS